jgi:hypothetical protein
MQNKPAPNKLRFTVLTAIILTAAGFRILPHPPNFSPIAALALFGGAQFASKRAAFLVPLAAMFLADLVLGLHALIPVIYACFALIVFLGFRIRQQRSAGGIAAAALVGSVLFFTATNFAVWAISGIYPKTIAGLTECYAAAIPFFQNTLAGDLFFTTVLFGGMALAELQYPKLRLASV